jgi:hypothetical protein
MSSITVGRKTGSEEYDTLQEKYISWWHISMGIEEQYPWETYRSEPRLCIKKSLPNVAPYKASHTFDLACLSNTSGNRDFLLFWSQEFSLGSIVGKIEKRNRRHDNRWQSLNQKEHSPFRNARVAACYPVGKRSGEG